MISTRLPTFAAWWAAWRRAVEAVKLWILLPFVLRNELVALRALVAQYARAQNTSAHLIRDMQQRLDHHEAGPLQGSKRELDRRRGDGMVRPVEAKRNGRRTDPIASLCVHGRQRTICAECCGPTGA